MRGCSPTRHLTSEDDLDATLKEFGRKALYSVHRCSGPTGRHRWARPGRAALDGGDGARLVSWAFLSRVDDGAREGHHDGRWHASASCLVDDLVRCVGQDKGISQGGREVMGEVR